MDFFKRSIRAVFSALKSHVKYFWRRWVTALIIFGFFLVGYILLSTPVHFSGATFSIGQGTSTPGIAGELADVRTNIFLIAHRLFAGDFGLSETRVTFQEGITVRDIAAQVADSFPGISAKNFLLVGQPYEGYLFPDTYFFSPSADALSIVAAMRANFNTKMAPLFSEISASTHSLSDIVIMASLIEKEARTTANRRIVAGILWNRLARGMPLQVDAVFGYIYGRDTYSPSFSDLKVDSPYNTYTHKGLPPGPIDNPGLDSLEAAANPTKTDYLYYLTGTDNLMHYAKTYVGHQANLREYLR